METYARWHGVPHVGDPAAGVDLQLLDGILTVRVLFSNMVEGLSQDLVLTFRHPVAVTSFDEFQHPWNFEDVGDLPRLTGKWASCTYPLLTVKGSTWVRQAEGNGRENLQHLRIVTLGDTVDIISGGPDKVSWEPGAS